MSKLQRWLSLFGMAESVGATGASSQLLPRIIGMVHVPAFPGTPASAMPMKTIIERCVTDARALIAGGVDGLLVENANDVPYVNASRHPLGPEIVAGMTAVVAAIKGDASYKRTAARPLPIGIQVLAAANKEALAVALATDCQFIRAEGFVFGSVADEGYIDASAPELLRARKMLGASDIQVLTDIKKKHSSHAITADLSDADTVEAARFFNIDGVILSGKTTGHATEPARVADAVRRFSTTTLGAQATELLPVLVGSGVTSENIAGYSHAHTLIVGTTFRVNGLLSAPIDEAAVRRLIQARDAIRR
ncbi:BtpA family protein [Capsaspora owczarzaki ATCC 30864]|uniref:BtpA family protein n=1 Tax=Capsaspora owczarzaki (strain ATCC 30864) TaxID=595528 RepID=A0A0D2VKS0_CAPO3|nr:BtpA family protein [Capsaspora owczarzaki ATCC 30864]KJE90642.1 BtpA family protein [Capsaspora owczarzaki ATCC 30864]|eukprot:XP_004364788.1 BtpA family protein [Capsaspora owczarzaki ATCC 30864]